METFKKCLICLEGDGNENEESEYQRSNLVEPKFRALSRYLALQDKSSLWRQATVCVECQNLLDKFGGFYRSLEKERMKVNACLKQIHNIMKEGSCHEEENAQDSENVEEDDLRKDILKKCEAKLERWEPKLKLQKMQFFNVEGTLAIFAKPSKPPPIRASMGVTNIIPVPFLTPDPDPAPPIHEFVVSDSDDSVGDMDTSNLFHPENFQTSEDYDIDLIDHDSAEDEVIVGGNLNREVHSELNEESTGNFEPIGFKDMGNGSHEMFYFCKICYDPNITDTAEHMRLNHTSNELEEMAVPKQQPVGKIKKARATPIQTNSKALSLSTKSKTKTGGARRGRGGHKLAPQPDFIIRKERVWKYGQRIWTYQCKLCDVTVLGVHLSNHKSKLTHRSNEKNYYKRLSQSDVRRAPMDSLYPPAEDKMLKQTNIELEMETPPAEPEPQVAVSNAFEEQAEQQPVGKNKKASATPIQTSSKALSLSIKPKTKTGGARRGRGGHKLAPQPDFIIRKERVWKYGQRIWTYQCKLCDVTVLGLNLHSHKSRLLHRSNEKNYYKRLSQSDVRRAPMASLYPPAENKTSDRPGTSMETSSDSDTVSPRICRKPNFFRPNVDTLKNKNETRERPRLFANLWSKSRSGQSQVKKCFVRRKRKPVPDFMKRTGSVFKNGSKRALYRCTICNISTVNLTVHKRKHGVSRFPCAHCTQTFQQTCGLVRHISTRHGEIIFHDYKKPSTKESTFRVMVGNMFRDLDKKAVGVISTSESDSDTAQTQKVYMCCFCKHDVDNNNNGWDGNRTQAKAKVPVQFKVFRKWRNHLFEKHRAKMGRELERMQLFGNQDHSEDELLI